MSYINKRPKNEFENRELSSPIIGKVVMVNIDFNFKSVKVYILKLYSKPIIFKVMSSPPF